MEDDITKNEYLFYEEHPQPVNVLEVMENDRQAHVTQRFFERAIDNQDYKEVNRIGRLLLYRHGIDLTNN